MGIIKIKTQRMQFEKDNDYLMYDGGEGDAVAAAEVAGGAAKGCDDEDKCCKCLPLGCGVKTLGVLTIIQAVLMILGGLQLLDGDTFIWGLIQMIVSIGPIYAAFKFIQCFRNDTVETRSALPKAFVIQYIFFCIGALLNFLGLLFGSPSVFSISPLINIGIQGLFTYYFFTVLVRYIIFK